ncbi:MAG: glycosyltransferase [Coriobacteriales bacterium]|jgi:glycosyltransferase involved in cell wall biosynthesis|nr:glycosyltransferase [Coriobacteriales bacterium]
MEQEITKTSTVPGTPAVTKRYAVLMAAYNEAELIQSTLLAAAQIPGVVGLVLADDGSSDATAQLAMRAGAFVVNNKRNLGKGSAMELAAAALEQIQPFGALDGVLLLDADVGESASAAAALLEPLAADTADLVIGILPTPPGRAGFGLARSLARDGIFEFGRGFESQAPLSGQRALTLSCLERVRPFASGYAMEVDMTIRALQQHQRVMELPVAMQHRHTGRNLKGFVHRGRQFNQINRLLNSYYRR